ncbi:MAG: hypothetical protein WDN04_01040 [Rhodospirillales bacterium]
MTPATRSPGLWQKIRTAVGRTYVMNFYIGNVHPTGYFAVMVNSCVEATIVGDQYPPSFTITYADGRSVRVTPAGVSDYTLVSFSFAGTGRDRVGFSAVNDDASYLVDDVSVAEAFAHGPGGRARRGAACGGRALRGAARSAIPIGTGGVRVHGIAR